MSDEAPSIEAASAAAAAEDRELLARAAAGEVAAFDRLVGRHAPALLRFARRICDSPHDGEDALQDALVQAWRAAAGFRGEGAVKGWLFRTVLNACHHQKRLRVGQPRTLAALEEAVELPASGAEADPAAPIERRERLLPLEGAFARLDPESREVLLLRDVEGLSGEEAAEALGLSLAAMKSRLHRARLELKRRYDEAQAGTAGARGRAPVREEGCP